MLMLTRTMIAVALVLTFAGVAAAQAVNKKVDLLPGGRTIGGPGIFTGEAGTTKTLLAIGPTATARLCGTLANTGKGRMSLNFQVTGGSIQGQVSPFPGEVQTSCRTDAVQVRATCNGPKPCKGLWRVDTF